MPRVSASARTSYTVASAEGSYPLHVATVVPHVDKRNSPDVGAIDVDDFAGQIMPHIQWGEAQPSFWSVRAEKVAEQVLQGDCTAVYEGPELSAVIAFAFLRQLKAGLAERPGRFAGRDRSAPGRREVAYVLDQFNVRAVSDLRDGGPFAERRLCACAALAHALLKPLAPETEVYAVMYDEDSRDGYFFRDASFKPCGDKMMSSTAGTVCEALEADPRFAFLSTRRLATV